MNVIHIFYYNKAV